MAVFAVYTQKTVPWRGTDAPVGNTYHLHTEAIEDFNDVAAINTIVAAEKTMMSSNAKFVLARSWGPTGGSAGESEMREVIQLSGTGALNPESPWYPELAYMIYWPLGRYGSRNRPQYLRKWIHTGKNVSVMPADGSRFTGTPGAIVQGYIDAVTAVDPAGVDGPYELCTEDGRQPIGPGKLYPYLEHRQIGQ